MKQPDCNTCIALDYDCGGHWSRKVRAHSTTATTGKITLDVYDGTHEHGANAYTTAEDE